ncbi:hypothetical protein [Brevundimonas sp.]|uniref:hypothetical protein n=1 Tax=Brevundimonas sp. TaxID=1871086 RepID=UPI00286B32F2|nr:hypothetical protein [Brevundimonas sp.]
MTARILLSSLLLAASLAACAGPPRSHPTYGQELDRLTADCTARGGILAPISGAQSGRPQTDYVCEIRGGTSRLTRGN